MGLALEFIKVLFMLFKERKKERQKKKKVGCEYGRSGNGKCRRMKVREGSTRGAARQRRVMLRISWRSKTQPMEITEMFYKSMIRKIPNNATPRRSKRENGIVN